MDAVPPTVSSATVCEFVFLHGHHFLYWIEPDSWESELYTPMASKLAFTQAAAFRLSHVVVALRGPKQPTVKGSSRSVAW